MHVLVVDDDANKLEQLTSFLHTLFPGARIAQRRSYQSGLKYAILERPDLLVLDMSMPTYDLSAGEHGGRARAYAGREILQEIVRKRVPARAVVVTQFESFYHDQQRITLKELDAQMRLQFDSTYLGSVYYSASQAKWRDDISSILKASFGDAQ